MFLKLKISFHNQRRKITPSFHWSLNSGGAWVGYEISNVIGSWE